MAIDKDPSTVSKEIRKHISMVSNSLTRRNEQGDVVVAACPLLARPPYVCNGCSKQRFCTCHKQRYLANHAQKEYVRDLS